MFDPLDSITVGTDRQYVEQNVRPCIPLAVAAADICASNKVELPFVAVTTVVPFGIPKPLTVIPGLMPDIPTVKVIGINPESAEVESNTEIGTATSMNIVSNAARMTLGKLRRAALSTLYKSSNE